MCDKNSQFIFAPLLDRLLKLNVWIQCPFQYGAIECWLAKFEILNIQRILCCVAYGIQYTVYIYDTPVNRGQSRVKISKFDSFESF